MAIGNGELMHECFPKHSRMGTVRMKQDKEADEKGKRWGVSMERSKAGMKKTSCHGDLAQHKSKYNNNKHNMVEFYKIWKKYNEIQLTKSKIDLIIEKSKIIKFNWRTWIGSWE